jgi:hypothetical protein
VSTTSTFVPKSLTATPYVVAPLDALQLNVTLLLAVVGPGLLVVPGLVLVGIGGILAVTTVKAVERFESPAEVCT